MDGNFSRRPRRGVVCVCVFADRGVCWLVSPLTHCCGLECVTVSVLLQSSWAWESKHTLKNSCPVWIAMQSLLCSNKCEWVIKNPNLVFSPVLLN